MGSHPPCRERYGSSGSILLSELMKKTRPAVVVSDDFVGRLPLCHCSACHWSHDGQGALSLAHPASSRPIDRSGQAERCRFSTGEIDLTQPLHQEIGKSERGSTGGDSTGSRPVPGPQAGMTQKTDLSGSGPLFIPCPRC